MYNVLITGGTGFLGVHLWRYLEALGNNVYILDKGDNFRRLDYISERTSYIKIELGKDNLNDIPDMDYVIHLAALPHVDYSFYYPKKTLNNNISSLVDMLEYVKNKNIKLLFASSVEVYSSENEEAFNEKMIPQPVSPYGVSKYTCEMILETYARCYGIKYNIFRLTNLFGEFQLPDRIIPRTICRFLNGYDIDVDRNYFRDFLYVKDACVAIDRLMGLDEYGGIYNISSGELRSMYQVVDKIKNKMEMGNVIVNETSLAGKQRHNMLKVDNAKIVEKVGFKLKYGFDGGLQHTINWYRRNKSWYEQFEQSYAADRISMNFVIDCINEGISKSI